MEFGVEETRRNLMAFTMANEGRYWMVTKTPSPVRPTDPDDITSYTYLDLYKNDAYPNRETEVLYNNADFKGYEPAYPLPPPPPTPLAPTQLKFFKLG